MKCPTYVTLAWKVTVPFCYYGCASLTCFAVGVTSMHNGVPATERSRVALYIRRLQHVACFSHFLSMVTLEGISGRCNFREVTSRHSPWNLTDRRRGVLYRSLLLSLFTRRLFTCLWLRIGFTFTRGPC